ncbi:hypothetical protein CsSME_00026310 [Camellia sinensis var. sinensis]
MGGGGAMKAAAKVAGITVVNGGLRGVPSVSPVEHQAATHRASRPVSSIVASTEEVNRSVLTAAQNNPIDAASQRPCWELDDWEFADGVAETIVNSGEPMPRLVFGGVPTLEEAKEATSELKEALDKYNNTFRLSCIISINFLLYSHQCVSISLFEYAILLILIQNFYKFLGNFNHFL